MADSDIALIMDAAAAVAAREVQGLIAPSGATFGVSTAFGAGTGKIGDPLHPGTMISVAPSDPFEPLQHFVNTAGAAMAPDAQDLYLLTWTISMALYLDRADIPTARALAAAAAGRYVGAYLKDQTLGGLCDGAWISQIGPVTGNAEWIWLPMALTVIERVRRP